MFSGWWLPIGDGQSCRLSSQLHGAVHWRGWGNSPGVTLPYPAGIIGFTRGLHAQCWLFWTHTDECYTQLIVNVCRFCVWSNLMSQKEKNYTDCHEYEVICVTWWGISYQWIFWSEWSFRYRTDKSLKLFIVDI